MKLIWKIKIVNWWDRKFVERNLKEGDWDNGGIEVK